MRFLRPFMLATALSLSLAALSPAAFAQLDDSQLPAAQEGHQGAIPYTTFSAEKEAATQKLYCKWTSEDGRDGGGRYDYLCVGGNWATVHLMFDKSSKVGNGLSRVRLLWREWPAAHPASAENVVAQQFLQYVADRFIAPKLVPEVMQSFFAPRARDWQNGDVRLHYELTDNGTHRLHKLEIIGLGTALKFPQAPESSFDKKLETWPANRSEEPTQVPPVIERTDRLPLQMPQPAPAQQPVQQPQQIQPVVQPQPKPLLPVPAKPVQLQAASVQQPAIPVAPASAPTSIWHNLLPASLAPANLPQPQPAPVAEPANPSLIPALPLTLPIAAKPKGLPQATPAELNTAPEPESLKKPVAAAEPSATLVPKASTITGQAPSNFDVYNKAQSLTQDVEEKAFGKVAPPVASPTPHATPIATPTPQQKSGGLLVAPPVEPETSITPVPTPTVESSPRPSVKKLGEGEGLGSPSTTPSETQPGMTEAQQAAQKAGKIIDAPSTVAPWDQPAPTGAARPLPQLKFIPKAQPLNEPADQTIQFEDEKSKL